MRYIRGYEQHKNFRINEEFVDKLVNGSLSNLMAAFTQPFKNIPEDIKKYFREDDPSSIKNMLSNTLNQSINGSLKQIRNLKAPIPGKEDEDNEIETIIDDFITSLTNLANGIGTDFSTNITDKNQASGANEIAKSILLGNKDAGWDGVITILNNPNYKYSKPKYEEYLKSIVGIKKGNDAFKAKQDAAYNFFQEFQKDITSEISKNLTEEELKKIYNDAVKKGGGIIDVYDYDSLLKFKNDGTIVKYKLKGYDENKAPDAQQSEIGQKKIKNLDKMKGEVVFLSDSGDDIVKKFSDIIGPVGEEDKTQNVNSEVTSNLKDLSKNPNNIKLMKGVTDAIKKDPSIINKIQEILPQ